MAKEKARADKEREKAEKLAKMNADEKKSYEDKKKDEETASYKSQIAKMQIENKAKTALSAKGYTADDDVPFVMRENEDSTLKAIDDFDTLIEKTVNEKIKAGARQRTPSTSSTDSSGGSLDLAEIAAKNRIIKN